ncbi:MAG TPA: choice-of-anchor D domain-containing protein [Kofleriaceae bacterium]|nr:choice-of-anchor D domain-containing protein [Kofleriaceae bacterium]
MRLFPLVLICAACGKPTSLADAPLAGDGAGADSATTADAAVPIATFPDQIDLGMIDCGGTGSATFTITNTGGAALTYSIAHSGTVFEAAPAQGTIAAGASQIFTVSAIVPVDSLPGTPLAGTLLVTTNLGGNAKTIQLAANPHGAYLTFTPASASFGDVEVSKSATQTITIANTGNASASIAIAAPIDVDDYAVSFTDGDLAPAAQRDATITYAPSGLGGTSTTAAITYTGPVCSAKPATLSMNGNGVPIGSVLVSGNVDFGSVACRTATTSTKTITLDNRGSATATWTAQLLGDTTDYSLSATSGSIAGNTTATLDVTRLAIAIPTTAGARDATVRITTTVGGTPTTHDVPVSQILYGPTLQWVNGAPASIDFGFAPVGVTIGTSARVDNTSLYAADVTVDVTGIGFTKSSSGGHLDAQGDGAYYGFAYAPQALGATNGTLTIDAANMCNAPFTVALTAGVGPYADISDGAVGHDCFAARSNGSIFVSNPGNQPLTITSCNEQQGTDVHPTFSPSSLTVGANGGSASWSFFWNDPSPLHSGTTVASVVCATNEKLQNQRVFKITRTLNGADLVLQPLDNFIYSCSQPGSEHRLKISNTGNRDASVLFSGSLPPGLESLASFANVGSGSSDTSMGARVGSGGCAPGGSGSIGVFGSGGVICSQTADLPVTTTN